MTLLLTTALGLLSGRSASPFYFSPPNSSVHFCGGGNAQLWYWRQQKGRTLGRCCSAEALSRGQLSPQMFGLWLLHSGPFSHLKVTSVVVFRVIVLLGGERSAQSEVPNPGSVFWCFRVSFTGRRFCLEARPWSWNGWSDGRPSATFSHLHQDVWSSARVITGVPGHACLSCSACQFQFNRRRN